MKSTRKRCDACKSHVAASWLKRHRASGCTVARGVQPPTPLFWLDSSLRLRPFNTLRRNGSYYGVRTIRPLAKRRWERVTEERMSL